VLGTISEIKTSSLEVETRTRDIAERYRVLEIYNIPVSDLYSDGLWREMLLEWSWTEHLFCMAYMSCKYKNGFSSQLRSMATLSSKAHKLGPNRCLRISPPQKVIKITDCRIKKCSSEFIIVVTRGIILSIEISLFFL